MTGESLYLPLSLSLAMIFFPASAEVFDGLYTPKRLQAMVEKTLIVSIAKDFLNLTYTNSQKSLPGAIDEMLINLPSG